MAFFSPTQKRFAQAVSRVAHANPFRPERADAEREALGDAYRAPSAILPNHADAERNNPNLGPLTAKAAALMESLNRERRRGARITESDWRLYEDLALFVLYHRSMHRFSEIIRAALGDGRAPRQLDFFAEFARELGGVFGDRLAGLAPAGFDPAAHTFAAFFQIRRAFHLLFHYLIGSSRPMAMLRGAAWESIFTHNMRRYRRGIFEAMGDIPSLITGPTGSGKELVARAIGMARYIPFDPKTRAFSEDFIEAFHPVNIGALAPTLIESELFGHRRGAFTGAMEDHRGWFEVCPPHGAVFLDEIGELDTGIQVKLLRVLQTRAFQRIGETRPLRFQGKVITATHRDLGRMMQEGRFREDLYYRLCADQLRTPTLREQLDDAPKDLGAFVAFIARRLVPADELADFTGEVEGWIRTNLPEDYAWSGNFRELEQCVRNLMIRRQYRPAVAEDRTNENAREALGRAVTEGKLTIEELLAKYCSLVYAECGSYQETARRLGVDHRTVKQRLDKECVKTFGRQKPV
ncbi:sigma 54-interacting transcriptional regulator [bacterium]|nr:sigma 54-interacting transcriptional regulator [bacterium]